MTERSERPTDEAPPPAPERWHGLIGEYGPDDDPLIVLEDLGRLVVLGGRFSRRPLDEHDGGLFEFPGGTVRFDRGADGFAVRAVVDGVPFPRREVGTRDGETFRITPTRPIDELRGAALGASPPAEAGDFRAFDLVEPSALDPTIELDIRYATTDNFAGAAFYRQARAFLQRPAAEALVRAHRRLGERGLGLMIHDAYRPWHVTKLFWDATPAGMRHFVADPAVGSRHNRGCAVDLTLYDRATGGPVPMVAGYDEFSPRSFAAYPGGTSRQRWHRDLLRRVMEAEGFAVYEYEWWHFDHEDWRNYPIGNAAFEGIMARP